MVANHQVFQYLYIVQSQSHIATDGQSISKSLSGAHDQIFITGLSLVYGADPRQHSLSRVLVLWDS
jgi:hypothetical protein